MYIAMSTFISEILFPAFIIGTSMGLLIMIFNARRILHNFLLDTNMEKSENAHAVIIHMQQTGIYINNSPQIKLQMRVTPDNGKTFTMETNQVVAVKDLENYKSGSMIKVKYSARDQHRSLIA